MGRITISSSLLNHNHISTDTLDVEITPLTIGRRPLLPSWPSQLLIESQRTDRVVPEVPQPAISLLLPPFGLLRRLFRSFYSKTLLQPRLQPGHDIFDVLLARPDSFIPVPPPLRPLLAQSHHPPILYSSPYNKARRNHASPQRRRDLEVRQSQITSVESNNNVFDSHAIAGRRRPGWPDCVIMEGDYCINTRDVKVCPPIFCSTRCPRRDNGRAPANFR